MTKGVKGAWTVDEDRLIRKYVGKYGKGNWALVAKKIEGRNGKQVRERYVNYLEKKGGEWTAREQEEVTRWFETHPYEWKEIGNRVGKTGGEVKRKWLEMRGKGGGPGKEEQMVEVEEAETIANKVGTLIDPVG